MDSVSDRDYAIEFLSACSILMMHLSRFAEEIILWCSWEFKYADLDDAYSTGSSIMPQKKNPDVAELVRGKTGRVYGDLMTLLTVMKALPLAYNKDMQEDKEPVFDAIDTVEMCLPVFGAMLQTLTIRGPPGQYVHPLRREPGNSDPAGLPCHQRPVRLRRVRSAGTEALRPRTEGLRRPQQGRCDPSDPVHQRLCG